MNSLLLLVIGSAIAVVFYFLGHFLTLPHDPKEPPLIAPRIPLIGHVIGLLYNGTGYYSKVAKTCGQPIFTLGLPRAKMYIVTSPSLLRACDRRARIVSFAPYVVDFARRILVASQRSLSLLSEDLLEKDGLTNLRSETMKAMCQSLEIGERLDQPMKAVLQDVSNFLESTAITDDPKGLSLFQWMRQLISIVSTDVFYGREKNPMRDPEVMNGFWAVDRDFAFLGLMILPSLAAPEASRGRTRFFDAFQKYYAAGGVQTAPHIVKARYEVNRKHGVSEDDIAHFDLSLCTALLVNTVPAICWTLYHVFSNPMLLAKLRQGIEAVVFSKDTTLEPSSTTINIPQVIQAFPLLESLVKEVLRVESNNSSARFLLEDTVINDGIESTYLLKKGSFLAMLSSPVHNNKTIWGPTPETFDPERFLKREGNRIPASAYRTFGGGNALCPGRHFAMYEIMSILTIMVLKYDFEPLEGQWNIPQKGRHISTSILTPVKDVWVRIKSREEVQGLKWSFVWKTEKS